MRHRLLVLIPILLLLFSGCQTPSQTLSQNEETGLYWPTRGWRVTSPEEQGMDSQLLAQMQDQISAQGINLHSLLIIRHGAIVSETYYQSFKQSSKHQMYSVTKSFISTLVGIAVDQGKVKVTDRVMDQIDLKTMDNLDDRKSAMTVKDLLTMTSGLAWQEGDPVYQQMYMSSDWVKMVMDLPMEAKPGQNFVYCSGCSHVLSAVVQKAIGSGTVEFARKYLFDPLGISNYSWEKDAQGISLGGWGLNITPRDMAKLGYLYLHQGQWEGKQVVSADWVKTATSRQVDAEGRLDYGYQWWIYDSHDAYTALGRDGQTIWVSPELDLIVVTTAEINGHDPIFALIDDYIVEAVIE